MSTRFDVLLPNGRRMPVFWNEGQSKMEIVRDMLLPRWENHCLRQWMGQGGQTEEEMRVKRFLDGCAYILLRDNSEGTLTDYRQTKELERKWMKTITAHLLDYTLSNHSGNNRSELARKLGIRRTDFNRIYDRCMQGEGGSRTTIEALLRLYCNEGYSMDEALNCYSGGDTKSLDDGRQECEERSRQMRMQMSNESKRADQRAQVMRSAEQMLTQIERAFCLNGCSGYNGCSDGCPCQRFAEFVSWVQKKLDSVSVNGER